MSPKIRMVRVSSLDIAPKSEADGIAGILMLCAIAPYPVAISRMMLTNFMICDDTVFNVQGNGFLGLQIYHFYFVQDYLLFKFA